MAAPWVKGREPRAYRLTLPWAEASALAERSERVTWPEPVAEASARRVAAAIEPWPPRVVPFDDVVAGAGAGGGVVAAGALPGGVDVVRVSVPLP